MALKKDALISNTRIFKAIERLIPDVKSQSLFDHIYAILYSRSYRGRYAQFLKSDFPRIPYPKDKKTFHALAAEGAGLRELHLMESLALDNLITTYPVGAAITKLSHRAGKALKVNPLDEAASGSTRPSISTKCRLWLGNFI